MSWESQEELQRIQDVICKTLGIRKVERGRKDVPGKGFDHRGQVGQQLLCWAATDISFRMMEEKIEEVEVRG